MKNTDYERSHTIRAVDTIDRGASVQLQLIEDLIDLSKIVQGKMHVEMRPLQIQDVIEEGLETITPAADAKSITIEKQVPVKDGFINGDPERLLQVLWNVLSNAVKFTPRGGRIRLSAERLDRHLEVSVTDSGIGINPEFLPYIFDRFTQGHRQGTRHTGLGLGLAIVRYFVELHGGNVTASSAGDGKGATFTIVLPSNPNPSP